MPIEMISPRTVYNRRPLGRYIVDNKVYTENNKNKLEEIKRETWSVQTINNNETELYLSGCHVVLHNFTPFDHIHLFTGYTDKNINCAAFVCFSHKASSNASITSIFEEESATTPEGVMLFTEDVGKYYGFNAEIFSCKLPCKVRRAWSIRNCLLAERAEDDTTHTSLFAMTHCLAEFTPVVFVDDFGNKGFVNDSRIRIAAICEKSLLLLAYSESESIFTLWRVRGAVKGDFEDLYQANMDGSVTIKMDNSQTRFATVRTGNLPETMDHDDECHTSKEYFECHTRTKIDVGNKTIDDLDPRSPLVQSFKSITDAELPVKRSPFHNTKLRHSKLNRSAYRILKSHLYQEPLYPRLCLQQLSSFKPHSQDNIFGPNQKMQHSTPMTNDKKANNRNTSPTNLFQEPRGFFAEDFYERKYLCFIKNFNSNNFLQIVKFNYDGANFVQFHEEQYRILDAIYLKKLKLIVMLEENRTLSIFTGMTFICKISLLNSQIYEPDLFADVGAEISANDIAGFVRLSEETDCGFTLHSKTGLAIRVYLPEMVRFHLVKKCLLTLKKLLPISIGTILLCRWYSLNRAVDNNESVSSEWPRFVDFMLENLGFRKERQRDSYIVGNVRGLCLDNSDISMEEICSKKLRTNYSLSGAPPETRARDQLGEFTLLALNICDQPLVAYAATVLYALHLVYETEKLNYSSSLYLENLAALNCSLAYCIDAPSYVEYYVTDYPDIWAEKANRLPSIREYIGPDNVWDEVGPPDWGRWFTCTMTGIEYGRSKYPIIEELNELTMNLITLWLVVFRHERLLTNVAEEVNAHMYRIKFNHAGQPAKYPCYTSIDTNLSLSKAVLALKDVYQRAACFLCEIGLDNSDLDYLNPGLAAIIKTICFHCSSDPPDFSNQNLYRLLHRTDLEKQRSLIMPLIGENRIVEVISSPPKSYRQISDIRQNCYSYWSNNVKYSRGMPTTQRKHRPVDNCYLLSILQDDPIIRLAYPDVRVGEAYKMLQSCSPVELDVLMCTKYTVEEGDSPSEALKEELDSHLKTITSQRTFALAFGRGMLGLQVLNSNSLTETLHVPPLCLSGKFLLSDSGKPHTLENPTSVKPWPCFHNGVAAGLMISPMNHLVDYVWILKQCPSNQLDKIDLSPEKAGVLFGLGLNGHLNKLSQATIGDTIKSMNEMATMAVLIGLSAYNLGSKNLSLQKHISFHYRCLIPEEKEHHNEQIPSLSQVSAIISAGLLNFKSGDRKMARILIEEMGRSREYLTADGSSPVDIELTSATAGFSVGLIMFQQGRLFTGRSGGDEYSCDDDLSRLIKYLKGGYRVPSARESSGSSEAPSDAHIRTVMQRSHEYIKRPQPVCQVDNWITSFQQTTNPRVLEGDYYNTDITGPGAAVALGMVYMASGDQVIARQLQCPHTFSLLEEIRSPLLCFRQIAWGMVLWTDIRPTTAWIEASIPGFIASSALQNRPPSGVPEQYWDTANESYFQLLVGSCFVMGLRYAGTDNSDARDTIILYINKLLAVKRDKELMQTLNRSQYEWALSTIFLSACMVTAGTGNLHLLKIVRHLRSINHPKEFANYGVNTTYSMAIGLLFLGGGKLTLSNSPRSAAILLIAFFPRFPPTYSSRRFHLQALRHLYVIACRPRVMCAVDIETLTAVPISSRIVFKSESRTYHGVFVYPPEDPATILEIEFFHKDGKYCSQKYRPRTESWQILLQSLLTGGYFFVKKRSDDDNLRNVVGSFCPEKMARGFELRDYSLLVTFLDVMGCGEICGENQMQIVTHLVNNGATGLREVLTKAAALDVQRFKDLCGFYDQCQESGKMAILSVLLVYMNVTLGSLRAMARGLDYHQVLTDEASFLMTHIIGQ